VEVILNKILSRLDSMDMRFDTVDARFDSVDKRFDSVDKRFDSMENRLDNLEKGQQSLQLEQNEMRKEVAFYFGTLMKELNQTKTELSSEVKHVSNIQKQNPDSLEMPYENEKHQ
jgi:chromosome segregation ATPase